MTATVDTADLVQTAGPTQPESGLSWGGHRRVVMYVVTLALVAASIVGGRVALNHPAHPTYRAQAVSATHPAAPFPSSQAIEAVWGMRFTNVLVLADNGGVELRYQVIDTAKAAKIHQGTLMTNELPTIQVEGTTQSVTPSAVLMHFHHGDASAGQTYSIIYGNAGGVIASGELVTIIMKDGLTIKHIHVMD